MVSRREIRFLWRLAAALVLMAVVFATETGFGAPPEDGGRRRSQAANGPEGSQGVTAEIKELIAKYAAAVNAEPVDIGLASRVWSNSSEVSLIYPLGEKHGWEQVKQDFYENTMETLFSQRTLTPRDIIVHAYDDSAWAEFSWRFVAKLRKGGSAVETNGLETQIYRKVGPHRWVLVHVHYSAMPPAARPDVPVKP